LYREIGEARGGCCDGIVCYVYDSERGVVGEVLNVYEVGVGVKQFTEKKGSLYIGLEVREKL